MALTAILNKSGAKFEGEKKKKEVGKTQSFVSSIVRID